MFELRVKLRVVQFLDRAAPKAEAPRSRTVRRWSGERGGDRDKN